MKAWFRADGNKSIGLGHIYRSLALVEALRERGAEVSFLTKTTKEAEKVLNGKAEIAEIQENSEKGFVESVEKEKPDVVVVDHYGIGSKTLKEVKETGTKLVCIDDLNSLGFYPVDLIVNQNIYAPDLKYNCLAGATVLAGTRYILMRKEFRDLAGKKRRENAVPKILVTFGGSDLNALTVRAARALKGVEEKFYAVFVLGKAFVGKEELEKELGEWKNGFELRQNAGEMAELMLECNFALSAAGTTIYELAFSGVPAITISQAENQLGIAEGMEKAGFSVNLGKASEASEETIVEAVKKMLQDKSLLKQRAGKGRQLVDGKGAERVAEKIFDVVEK